MQSETTTPFNTSYLYESCDVPGIFLEVLIQPYVDCGGCGLTLLRTMQHNSTVPQTTNEVTTIVLKRRGWFSDYSSHYWIISPCFIAILLWVILLLIT